MDMSKIGISLQLLRKERGLTQEQLGEQLGVSGKTVSRWETGTYLPPVEMLQLLSDLYGLTINELLAGQRLTPEAIPVKTEESLTAPVREKATFQLNDQRQYWIDKWIHDHRLTLILLILLLCGAQIAGLMLEQEMINIVSALLALCAAVYLRNARDNYVEHHLYDEKLPRD